MDIHTILLKYKCCFVVVVWWFFFFFSEFSVITLQLVLQLVSFPCFNIHIYDDSSNTDFISTSILLVNNEVIC